MKTRRIGDWLADPEANELHRGAETVRLEPKAMAVLMLFAERPGRLLTREELFARAWPGMVVGDEALTQCIIKLRRALGDNARAATYIDTVSKRGYRLIAPVGDAEPHTASATHRPLARRLLPALGLAGVAAVVAPSVVYFSAQSPASSPDSASVAASAAGVSVTVLPFEPVGEGDHAYLARGMSEDLMTELSRLAGVQVIAAAHRAEGRARYVVSGSVQRLSHTLRVNVRLVDSETGRQLWSERFERPLADLFAVQNEMLARVAAVLPGKLTEAARERMALRYTSSLEAYDLFLRATSRFLARQAEENDAARALYRKALALDPKFARAYAGLAMTYAIEARLRPDADATAALQRARELAETAHLIDQSIPEVHWALGFVHAQGRRHEEAIRSLEKAIELNHSFADGYALMGGIYTYLGQPAKSIPLLRTALRLNPDGSYLYYLLLGRAYLFEEDLEQALINLREAVQRNPADVETRLYLAAAMAAAGDHLAAEWEREQIHSLAPGFSLERWLQTYPLTSAPHRESLVQLLAAAGF
jgi:DNA-binding winged helix-turn-helix (wHTH) protein/TolB-like protein/Flp pilus assembly protein TadD